MRHATSRCATLLMCGSNGVVVCGHVRVYAGGSLTSTPPHGAALRLTASASPSAGLCAGGDNAKPPNPSSPARAVVPLLRRGGRTREEPLRHGHACTAMALAWSAVHHQPRPSLSPADRPGTGGSSGSAVPPQREARITPPAAHTTLARATNPAQLLSRKSP